MIRRRSACLFLLFAFAGLAGGILYQGHRLTQSANHPVMPKDAAGCTRVEFAGAPGRMTRGFLCEAPGDNAFLLAHGNSSDGASMLPRARWLVSQGYSVLIPDLQAHGETPGARKTFGWREAEDVAAAFRHLQTTRNKKWIGAIGSSLGGAAVLKAAADGTRFDVLILESVYADIATAVRNRLELRLGWAGKLLEPVLTGQLPLWCGLFRSDLNPKAWAKEVDCNALVLVGGADRLARPWESKAIFANLQGTRKRILELDGAGHVDLFVQDAAWYAEALSDFLPAFPGAPDR